MTSSHTWEGSKRAVIMIAWIDLDVGGKISNAFLNACFGKTEKAMEQRRQKMFTVVCVP